jgi:hypothetical protein
MIETLILAAAIGGCPIPGALAPPHKHHKHKPVPETSCGCLEAYPRTIVLPAPEPDIEPINLGVYRYYTVISFNDTEYAWYDEPWPYDGYASPPQYGVTLIGGGGRVPTPRQTPEIDPSGAAAGLTLLAGALLVMRGRRLQSTSGVTEQ